GSPILTGTPNAWGERLPSHEIQDPQELLVASLHPSSFSQQTLSTNGHLSAIRRMCGGREEEGSSEGRCRTHAEPNIQQDAPVGSVVDDKRLTSFPPVPRYSRPCGASGAGAASSPPTPLRSQKSLLAEHSPRNASPTTQPEGNSARVITEPTAFEKENLHLVLQRESASVYPDSSAGPATSSEDEALPEYPSQVPRKPPRLLPDLVVRRLHPPRHPPPPIAETDIEEQPTTIPAASPPAAQKAAKPTKPKGEMTAAVYGTIQEEKARALFAKYGLTLEPGEWTKAIKPDGERVEKKIRMRVHRTCHYCQTTFGPDRVCSNCKHSRCKKCPRYPTKRTKEQKGKAIAAAGGGIATTGTAAAAIADTTLNLKSLIISSRPTGKKVTYKPVTQRVRRTCHLCSTLFEGRAIECANCGHNRCPQCPRDPAKLDKYPSGYPGDSGGVIRERHPIRVHVRWTCHQCSKTFRDLSKKCEGCQHDRCGECPRHPPKREKPNLDPDAVKKIQERMETMDISPQAVAA
ncbi:MAG: hypothetical protein Q9173_005418, partial [Seirophora scorigena]